MRKFLIPLAAFTLLLAGCGDDETRDRTSDSGKDADGIEDVTSVTVYRNIDRFPNVAVFRVDGCAFATTTHNDTRGASLVRVPEFDQGCQQ